ncbi:hypothetical protein HYPSUDRAFT_202427 [Hypholoma sublateritium FD-334 SS-4]|uniref:Uncharacterized protein n=1 Tax=Hypholoma sublateritium (strain FD-334 SS-4) TaxID=945553 RepID=A0A0D2NTN2_HYPSF|nr:hypothetical protein HYPSUDRAFT_202427 [Hypholoma sublateritium FD-334 SS-4]
MRTPADAGRPALRRAQIFRRGDAKATLPLTLRPAPNPRALVRRRPSKSDASDRCPTAARRAQKCHRSSARRRASTATLWVNAPRYRTGLERHQRGTPARIARARAVHQHSDQRNTTPSAPGMQLRSYHGPQTHILPRFPPLAPAEVDSSSRPE